MSSTQRPHRRSGAVTIRDVAAAADVSIATVSRVLSGNATVSDTTRERVERAVARLDFTPSRLGRSLAERRHAANGIVFPDLSGPYYAEVVLGYEAAASELGRSVLILSTHGRVAVRERVLDLASRVDGMVIFGRTVGDDIVAEVARRIPVVVIARTAVGGDTDGDPIIDSVNSENRSAAVALAEHLVASGTQRPLLVGDPHGSSDVAERWAGLIEGFAAAGITPLTSTTVGLSESEGSRIAGELVDADTWGTGRADGPDAIVCANDELALGALERFRAAGVAIPDQIALTGWDDVMAAHWAGLTTVSQPMREIGERAAQLIDARIAGYPGPARHELLSTHLVARITSDRHR